MSVTLEDLLAQTGDCGRYQFLLVPISFASIPLSVWGMMMMVFGAKEPDWWGKKNGWRWFSPHFPYYRSQMGDSWGRKKTLMAMVILQTVFNLVAVFSTSWEMFAIMRFLPESVRWLSVKGHVDKAQHVLQTIARWNGRKAPDVEQMHEFFSQKREAKSRRRTHEENCSKRNLAR
nr:hypothetical protein BaRGS_023075 [Batillaria attramentaria]